MIDQYSSLSEKFMRKGIWLYIFSFIIAPIGYIIKIILSQELSVAEVGILYGVISLVTIFSAFSDFGIKESLSYFIPKYVIKKEYFKVKTILFYSFIIQAITGAIMFCIFFFGSKIIAQYYFQSEEAGNILIIFSFFFLGLNIFQILNSFFIAVQNTFLQKGTEFLRMGVVLLSTLGIYIYQIGDIIIYSFSWLIGVYVGLLFSMIIFYKKYYQKYLQEIKIDSSKDLFMQIISYALIIFLATQSNFILSQIDMQMVLFILGTESAGYYTNYLSLASIPNMILGPIFILLFPIISELISQKNNNKVIFIKKLFQKYFLNISIAFCIFMFLGAHIISFALFGEKFITSGEILQYSILLMPFNFLLKVNYILLNTSGKSKERLYIILFAIIINIITNIIFINLLGVYGAAVATGLGWIIIWLLTEWRLKDFRVGFDLFYLLKNIVLMGSVGYVLYYFLLGNIGDIDRVTSLLYVLFTGVIFFISFLLLNKAGIILFIKEIKKIKQKHV